MRIVYEEQDTRALVIMECSALVAVPNDDEEWSVIVREYGRPERVVLRDGLFEHEAKNLVYDLVQTVPGQTCL